jgi:hypothetical protein
VVPGVGGVESADAEEFRAFQEWRSAVQVSRTEGERGHGKHVLGAKALHTRVGSKGYGSAAVGPQGQEGSGSRGVSKRNKEEGLEMGPQQVPP